MKIFARGRLTDLFKHDTLNWQKKPILLAVLLFLGGPAAFGEPASNQLEPINLASDPYFLSEINPTATRDQIEMENLALRLLKTPQVQKAKKIAAMKVKTLVHGRAPSEAWDRFDEVMDEWTMGYVQKAVNADPNYPRVLRHVYGAPHNWYGVTFPGNRAFGGDNPDSLYSMIPVDPYATFKIIGKNFSTELDAPIQLCSNLSLSSALGFIPWEDVEVDEGGNFVITISPEPMAGRKNYIQSSPEAKFIILRNTMSDWTVKPNAYKVVRMDPPVAKALTFEELADRAALYVVDDIPASLYWLSMVDQLEYNQLPQPFVTGSVGGMWSARMTFGKLKLEDDEAYVLTMDSGRARFRNLVLYDYWQYSLDYGNRLTSMSDAQSDPNPDGSTTFVISKTDPGIYNWIDTFGLNYPKIMLRWQQLPDTQDNTPPTVTGQIVKLSELAQHLPPTIRFVTAEERAAQIEKRRANHQMRFQE